MSDINITLDAGDAIRDAGLLKTELNEISTAVTNLQAKMSKFILRGSIDLKAKALTKDMNNIRSAVAKQPIYARVLLRLDKRTLTQSWIKKGFEIASRVHVDLASLKASRTTIKNILGKPIVIPIKTIMPPTESKELQKIHYSKKYQDFGAKYEGREGTIETRGKGPGPKNVLMRMDDDELAVLSGGNIRGTGKFTGGPEKFDIDTKEALSKLRGVWIAITKLKEYALTPILSIDTSAATLALDKILAKLKLIKAESAGRWTDTMFSGGTFEHPGPGVETSGAVEKRIAGEEKIIKKLKRQDAAYKGHETRAKNLAAKAAERERLLAGQTAQEKKLIAELQAEDAIQASILAKKRAAMAPGGAHAPSRKGITAQLKSEESIQKGIESHIARQNSLVEKTVAQRKIASAIQRSEAQEQMKIAAGEKFLLDREKSRSLTMKNINVEAAKESVIAGETSALRRKVVKEMLTAKNAGKLTTAELQRQEAILMKHLALMNQMTRVPRTLREEIHGVGQELGSLAGYGGEGSWAGEEIDYLAPGGQGDRVAGMQNFGMSLDEVEKKIKTTTGREQELWHDIKRFYGMDLSKPISGIKNMDSNMEALKNRIRGTTTPLRRFAASLLDPLKSTTGMTKLDGIISSLQGSILGTSKSAKNMGASFQQAEKQMKVAEDLMRSLSEKEKVAGRTIGGLQAAKQYGTMAEGLGKYKTQLLKGEITQKQFNKHVTDTETRMKKLDKSIGGTNKTVRQGRGFFMNFTMALTAVAAAMFIWQKVKQVITEVVDKGKELSTTFAKMRAETDILTDATGGFASQFQSMSKGTIWGVTDMYEAYKELQRQGLGADAAMRQIIPTLKIARNEDMELADAANMAAFNTMGLRDQYLRLDDEMQKTGGEAWDKLKRSISGVFESAYMRAEPAIIKTLESLSKWVDDNAEELIKFFKRIIEIGTDLLYFFTRVGGAIAKFIGNLIDLQNAEDKLTKAEKLEKKLAQYERMEKDILAQINIQASFKIKEPDMEAAKKSLSNSLTVEDMTISPKITVKPDIVSPDKKVVREIVDQFSTMEDTFTPSTIKSAGDLEKQLSRVRTEIIAIKKELAAEAPKETGVLKPKVEDITKAWQYVYDQTGRMTERFYQSEMDKAVESGNTHISTLKKIGDTGGARLALLAQRTAAYNLEWQKLAPYMKEHQDYFETTSRMSDEYYNHLIRKMEQEIRLYDDLSTAQQQELINIKKKGIEMMKLEAEIKPYREIFDITGSMSDKLYELEQRKGRSKFRTRLKIMGESANHEDILNAERAFVMNMIEIDKDKNAMRLDIEQQFFDATGQQRQEYMEAQLQGFARTAEIMRTLGFPEEETRKAYRQMANDFMDEFYQPALDGWNEYYEQTGKMSQKHYELEAGYLQRHYEYLLNVLEDEEAAYRWLYEQTRELMAKDLESHENVCDGIRAAWLRLTEDTETLSKKISDVVVAGIGDMEQAWKEGFFDIINGEWDNLEDHVINVLTSLRNMLNEMLYEIIKDWAKPKLAKMFGGLFGGEEDMVAKKIKENAAITEQNALLAAQIGVVASLTLAYQALAMAMAACRMGVGSGTDAFGSGFSFKEIAEWDTLSSWHKGGQVGIDTAPHRLVASSVFVGAPRFHDGLLSDEVPAVLKKGEYVLTPKQMEEMQKVIIKDTVKQLSVFESATKLHTGLIPSQYPAPVIIPQESEKKKEGNVNTISINVPVNVEGNTRLANRMRDEVESLIKEIMREETR